MIASAPVDEADCDRFFALFDKRGPDGQRLFTLEQVADFVALMLYTSRQIDRDIPAVLGPLVSALIKKAGLEPKHSPEEIRAAIGRYYQAHPPPAGLLEGFRAWVHGSATKVDCSADTLGRAWLRFWAEVGQTVDRPPQRELW